MSKLDSQIVTGVSYRSTTSTSRESFPQEIADCLPMRVTHISTERILASGCLNENRGYCGPE